jgi:hypothetical protein
MKGDGSTGASAQETAARFPFRAHLCYDFKAVKKSQPGGFADFFLRPGLSGETPRATE